MFMLRAPERHNCHLTTHVNYDSDIITLLTFYHNARFSFQFDEEFGDNFGYGDWLGGGSDPHPDNCLVHQEK